MRDSEDLAGAYQKLTKALSNKCFFMDDETQLQLKN